MFAHLENFECLSSYTIQHINTIALECSSSSNYVIKAREPWLRAGVPPSSAQDSHHDAKRNKWKCPICKIAYSSKDGLDLHFRTQDCCSGFPAALKCPDCGSLHTKLSALIQHVESEACAADIRRGSFKGLLDHMETAMDEPTKQEQGAVKVRYGLRFDPSRPGKLYVKVTEVDN